MLSPTTTVSFAQAGMMAPDGRCKTFDARADGYTRGEGCGLVVLKRLSDAQREGDRVLGVILGSATNQDGRSNGLTAPCGKAQIRVIRKALESANVQPTQISYVETHGTGTTLGDAVEVASLAEVLSNGPGARQPCILSAVKTNIGHLESAAGVAALIKVVLALQHNAVAPVVHFQTLSPKIDFGGVPFVIPRTLQSWTRDNGSRYAGISGFSFGGANVHLIVGDPPDKAAKAESSTPGPGKQRLRLLPLSAKSAWSLKQLASRYAEHLANSSDVELEDVCYTASTHRSHFSHRLTVSGRTSSEIAEQLHSFVKGEGPHDNYRDSSKSNGRALRGFLFTGSAIDAHHLALDLFETEPRFRQILEEVDMALRADEQGSVLSVLYPELSSDSDPTMARSSEVARFCVEYALAQLCQSWGIHPTVVAGQGAGAYLAACVGGALSFADALKIAFDATLVGSVVGKPVETRLVCGLTGRAVEPGEVPGREWFMEANAQVDVTGGLPVVALNNEVMWLRFGMGQPVSNEKDTGVIDLLDPQGRAWPKLTPAVATLYREGARIKWAEFNKGFGGRKTSLPTYPFQRRRCWLEPHEIRAHIEASRL
jgi:acyl transferase domain-containing protein